MSCIATGNTATLSTVEVATMLGRTRHCIRQWCESGRIEATKDPVSGCFRIPEAAVMKLTTKTRSLSQRRTHTLAEAAAILGLPKAEVVSLCDHGHLPFVKLPTRRILIEAVEIDRLLARYRA